MTAKVLDVPPDELKSLGVVGVIPKPFDPVSLPAQVNKLWLAAKGQGA